VPKGVDPTFAFNVGKTREQGIDKAFSDKFGKLPEEIAKTVIKDIIASNRFEMLKDGKMSGQVPVAILSKKLAQILIDGMPDKSKSHRPESFTTVFFSKSTADKQRKIHTKLTSKDYENVQWLIENGQYVADRKHHLTFVGNNDRPMKAVVKRSSRGEYFLQSLHEIKKEQIQSILKR